MGGTIAIKYVVWFKLNVFRVTSITKDHKDDDDQDYLGGPVPPLAPSWAHHCIRYISHDAKFLRARFRCITSGV